MQQQDFRGTQKNTEPQYQPKGNQYHNGMIRGADIYDNSYLRNHPVTPEEEPEAKPDKKKKPASI